MNKNPHPKAKSENDSRLKKKISRNYIFGTTLLAISTILLILTTISFDFKIGNKEKFYEGLSDDYKDYRLLEIQKYIALKNFELSTIITTDCTYYKSNMRKRLDNEIKSFSFSQAVISDPKDSPNYVMLDTLNFLEMTDTIMQRGKYATKIMNDTWHNIKVDQWKKNWLTLLIIILQVIGLILNQRAIILQVKLS